MSAKILIVDDEPAMVTLIERQFRTQIRDNRYSFVSAADGLEALALLSAEPDIDMVLTDINMPNMDGLTLLQKLPEIDPYLKAVIVSAYGDMDNIRVAMNRGAYDFITKPIDFRDLEVTLEKTLVEVQHLREAHRQRARAERERACLMRYFSPNLVSELTRNPDRIHMGVERRELSFVFTDLSGFTPLIERIDPEAVYDLLNAYMQGMIEIAFAHGGTVEKIVGDALHLMFGAPEAQPDHATRAVHCALDLDAFAHDYAARKRAEGITLGETRIGVNTGPVIVGNFGGGAMFDYTAHGDAINTAERLQSANKRLGTRICISEHTVANIEDFVGRPIGRLHLKGRAAPLLAYEPIAESALEPDALAAYRNAYELMEQHSPDAGAALSRFIADYPAAGPELAALHLRRLTSGEHGVEITI